MKTALVTGADRGFGLSVSKRLLERGWTVYAGKYIEAYDLLERASEQNPHLRVLWLDMGAPDSIRAARAEVEREAGRLDMIVSNAALMGMTGKDVPTSPVRRQQEPDREAATDLDHALRSFQVNALGAVALASEFLPLLARGDMKRLCFVSSEVSSISMMNRESGFAYPMSKSALNMGVRMLHNDLFKKGYTFRLYHPGWMRRVMPDGRRVEGAAIDPDESADFAIDYFLQPLPDEERLVLVDYLGNEWPF